MIDIALNYEEELQRKFRETWFKDKYKYYHNGVYHEEFKLSNNTWDNHQFVVLNKQGEVTGFISYEVNRSVNCVNSLGIVNFTDDVASFAVALLQVIDDIFVKFNFDKLVFHVVVGNPAEKHYDRLVKRIGGRVVGTFTNDTKLTDGKLYDIKFYEVLKSDYIKN